MIGGVGEATTLNADATLNVSSTMNTTLFTVTGGAAIASVAGHVAAATITGNAIIGGGGIE